MLLIFTPWDFKIYFGIIADTVKIPGFKKQSKKAYLMLFTMLECIVLLIAASVKFESYLSLLKIFFVVGLCSGFNDVIVDGLNCI